MKRRSLRVLRHRGYRHLVSGSAVSALGNAITPVALAFAVLDLGGSVVQLGLVEAVFAACQVVTTLAGGVLGDRVSRQLMMTGASAASALVMGGMAGALLLDVATIPLIATLGGLGGVVSALGRPSAMAMTRLVVPEDELGDAVALRTLLQTSASTVGYAVAGALVAAVGSGWAIMADACTFVFAAVAFALFRVPHVRTPRAASALADLKDGLREVMRHSWLWLLILQALLYHLFYGGAQAVLGPVVVGDGIGRSAWGLALSVLMAGFVVGGLLCLRVRPGRPLAVGVVLLAFTGFFPLAMALSDTLWPILLGAFLHGLGLQMFDVYWEQSIQSHVPEDRLARVYAFDTVGSFVARPVGLALTGPVATAVGFDVWLLVVAAVISGVSLVALAARGVRHLERVS
ncbi:MFS transporter [Streptomyces sp. NPDC093586]|uniref:MFS transporter n=1 Tax=Streptomyces sp. NPDC093586 TaxID=3366042 RepID=UPI0038222960